MLGLKAPCALHYGSVHCDSCQLTEGKTQQLTADWSMLRPPTSASGHLAVVCENRPFDPVVTDGLTHVPLPEDSERGPFSPALPAGASR